MKKRFFSLFLCAALLLSIICPAHTAWADTSSGGGYTYTDPNTGAFFVVPEGWVLEETPGDSLQANFIPLDGSQKSISYGSDDLWGNSTVSERSGKSRSDYNLDFLLETAPDEIVLEEGLAIPRDDLERVSYGKNEYLQLTIEVKYNGVTVTATYAITLENGYTYNFWFFRLPEHSTKDFESMLSSLQIPRAEETDFADEPGLVGGDTYTDPDTGATFVVPENWTEDKLLERPDTLTQIGLVSLNDFKSSIQYHSYDVWNKEMTASERDGHTRSDIDSAYAYTSGMFQKMLVDTFVQQGFDVTAEDIRLVTYGKMEYIELTASQEISGITATLTMSCHIENGYLYDFTFGGANDEAARDFQSVLHSLQVPASAEADFADGGTYTDPDTGTTFVVPEGWNEVTLSIENSGIFQVQFSSQKYPGSTLMYGSTDLWSEMTASERSGLTRSEANSAYLYEDKVFLKSFADQLTQEGIETSEDDMQLVTYGKNECIEIPSAQTVYGIRIPFTIILYLENGYFHIFMFGGTSNEATEDFQSILYSLQVPESESSNEQNASGLNLSMLNPLTFLINLLLTFFVYTLPILFYRFVLHSSPLEKKQAKKAVTIYGICAYLLMCFIMALFTGHAAGVSIFFWSYVNYYILTSGKRPEPKPADTPAAHTDRFPLAPTPAAPSAPVSSAPAAPIPQAPPAAYTPVQPASTFAPAAPQTPAPAPRIQFCRKCGFRLLDDSKFCSVCGASIVPISKEGS